MKRWLTMVLGGVGLAVAIVAAVVLVRASAVESLQSEVEPVEVETSVDGQAALERLAEAIRKPTISSSGDDADLEPFYEFRRQLERDFPVFHDLASRQLVNDLTLHFTLEGRDSSAPHVVFLAHQDVVPVEEGTEDDWTHPPFGGVVADGFLWGRGTLDNKQNVMAMLEAAESWLESGESPEHTVHFVFGHDEEIGGMDGARVVAQQMEEDGLDVVAVYDEGLVIVDGMVPGIDGPIALVGITERGYLTVEIEARAEGGHSSMPPEEIAVTRLAEVLKKLDANPRPAAIDGPTAMMFEWAISEMDFLHRMIFRNLWLFEPVVLSQMTASPGTNAAVRTTAAPTMLRASDTENVLPQRAVATVNFRLNPRDSIDGVLADLEDLLGSEYITIRPVGEMRSEPSPLARLEGPGFEKLRRALATVHPDVPVAPNMLTGAADARHFTGLTHDVYRFQPLIFTDRDLERLHGTDERIAVDDYLALIEYYGALLRQW